MAHQMPNWRAVAAGLQGQAVLLDHLQKNEHSGSARSDTNSGN